MRRRSKNRSLARIASDESRNWEVRQSGFYDRSLWSRLSKFMTTNPIIVALDFEDAQQARTLVSRVGPAVDFYKVGMELYAAAGMPFVRELIGEGKQVFLDLKLYDIGETVKRAVAQV